MASLDRRLFLEFLSAIGLGAAMAPRGSSGQEVSQSESLSPNRYRPGRIVNEYSHFLPGERGALQTPPTISAVSSDAITVEHGGQTQRMRPNDQLDGWRLVALLPIEGMQTAVFEKHASYRGMIAYVTEQGISSLIPKHIGELAYIRPRQTDTPHNVRFERATHFGPDVVGQYILNSAEDPCYENVAALGPEYVGWTLVANEEAGPRRSLYLDAVGRSRELNSKLGLQGLWAPDAFDVGPVFDPVELLSQEASIGFSSKRTLLGGYLPVADLAVWNPAQETGYEIIVLLPPGADAKPMARMRSTMTPELIADFEELKVSHPELSEGVTLFNDGGRAYQESYWQGTAQEFHSALSEIWRKWQVFHESALQVDIPDEWLLNAARAGITLSRCSYTGLDPTYQIGEGGYTKAPPSSHALFPVAHYEFIWAQQLWNHVTSSDSYFQHYLDRYIEPDGNFTYNVQDQVEGPLNIGLVLANSARSYFYTRDLTSLERRLPVLERMLTYVLKRYEYSKNTFASTDPRHGLIWGSPEADLGDPKKDGPADHPYYYQNAVCVWRGIEEHAKALGQAAEAAGRSDLRRAATRYIGVAGEMRRAIEASLATTLAACSSDMRSAGITPFTPDDTRRDPAKLESYENHRFMEDWFLADWGDRALDAGHLKHRVLANRQVLGIGLSGSPGFTSNFMAHGTLAAHIRQDDYRPFLLALYALTCYAADSGNRYAPEDAYIPGGHALEGPLYTRSAVVNSTLQPAMGLRWLLCYEENDQEVCHLQKGAPKHWFSKGESIAVRNCPTRFGPLSWATQSVSARGWRIVIDLPAGFSADLLVHIHPSDDQPLRTTSLGALSGNAIVLHKRARGAAERLTIFVT